MVESHPEGNLENFPEGNYYEFVMPLGDEIVVVPSVTLPLTT
jgi:hypothetical protein